MRKPSRISIRKHCGRLAVLATLLLAPVTRAQLSPYDDRLIDNMKVIDGVYNYLWDSNSPGDNNYHVNRGKEMVDLDRLRQALAEVYAAFGDEVTGEYEEKQMAAYRRVQQQFITGVDVYRDRIDEMLRWIEEGGAPAEPAKLRFQSLIEQNAFALPILMFEGETPWHDLYRDTLKAYREMEGKTAGVDPFKLRLPRVNAKELGSLEIETLTMKRAKLEAERAARNQARKQERDRERAAVDTQVAAEVKAAQEAAEAEAAAMRAEAERMIREAGGSVEGGEAVRKGPGFFGWLFRLILLLVVVGTGLWFLREKLPPSMRLRLEQGAEMMQGLLTQAKEKTADLKNKSNGEQS